MFIPRRIESVAKKAWESPLAAPPRIVAAKILGAGSLQSIIENHAAQQATYARRQAILEAAAALGPTEDLSHEARVQQLEIARKQCMSVAGELSMNPDSVLAFNAMIRNINELLDENG